MVSIVTDRVPFVTLHSYVEVFQNDRNMVLLDILAHSFCVHSSDKINLIRTAIFSQEKHSQIYPKYDVCLSDYIKLFLLEENNIISVWIVITTQILLTQLVPN